MNQSAGTTPSAATPKSDTVRLIEWLTLACWSLLVVTGVYLMLRYRPTASAAYSDMETLRSKVTVGLVMRRIHNALAWPAMGLPVALAVMRFQRALRRLGAVAIAAFGVTAFAWFTGKLLPWDQLALWSVTAGTNMMGFEPIFGDDVRFVLLGGAEVSVQQLRAWLILHTIGVSSALGLLAVVYAAMSRSQPDKSAHL